MNDVVDVMMIRDIGFLSISDFTVLVFTWLILFSFVFLFTSFIYLIGSIIITKFLGVIYDILIGVSDMLIYYSDMLYYKYVKDNKVVNKDKVN